LEFINQAKKLKMKVIASAITAWHTKLVSSSYFRTCQIPAVVDGIRVLKGIEANIANEMVT